MTQSGQETGNTSGTDGAQDQKDSNNSTGTDGAQGTGNGGGTGADSEQQNSGANTGNDTVSRAEFDRMRNQLSAADKKREDAEKELKSIKDKDLSELEKAKSDFDEVVKDRDGLKSEVERLRLANAFLSSNTITWQNSDVALDIAQSKGYLADVVSEDGTADPKKMGAALKKLADDHKYLVKDQEGDESGGGSGSGGQHGASGESGPRGSNNADDKDAKDKRLRHQFPALGRR